MTKKPQFARTVTVVAYESVVDDNISVGSCWRVTGLQKAQRRGLVQVVLTELELGRPKE